ncbi:MAG: DUF6463 family protein [Elainellaceae cyanobacterium]
MKKVTGFALMGIGLLHSLLALLTPRFFGFSDIWQDIAAAGVVDAASPESLRIWGFYWLLMPGFLLILFGLLCDWIERQLELPLPSFVGWGLLAIALFGIVLDIDTGFWLVLVAAINAIAASRHTQQTV